VRITWFRRSFEAHSIAEMARVFLSYAREDHDVREFLGSHLVAAGVEVFVDMAMEPGTPAWTAELEKRLEASDAVVVLMTPSSKQSEWVRNECGYAFAQSVPIIPLLARGDERTSVPMELIRYQRIDLGISPIDGVRALVARLLAGPRIVTSSNPLQLRGYELVQVSKFPVPSWRWSAWISAAPNVQHNVNKTALARMGGKKIGDVKLLKNDNALFRSSGVFRSLIGGDIIIHAAVFRTQNPAVQSVVAHASTTNWILRRDQVRELIQQFALTMGGLVTEAGGVVMQGP
jgi:hypothetical protein